MTLKREQDLSFSPFFFVLSFLFEILRRDINDLHYDNRNDDENNRRAISLQNLKQMWKNVVEKFG